MANNSKRGWLPEVLILSFSKIKSFSNWLHQPAQRNSSGYKSLKFCIKKSADLEPENNVAKGTIIIYSDGNINWTPPLFAMSGLMQNKSNFSSCNQNMAISGLKLLSSYQEELTMQLRISFILLLERCLPKLTFILTNKETLRNSKASDIFRQNFSANWWQW